MTCAEQVNPYRGVPGAGGGANDLIGTVFLFEVIKMFKNLIY